MFTRAPFWVSSPRLDEVRASRIWQGGHEDDLLGPGVGNFLQQTRSSLRPITQMVRLALPDAAPSKLHRVRISRDGKTQRSGQRVDRETPGRSPKINRFQVSLPPLDTESSRKERASEFLLEKGKYQIASSIEVVDSDEKLSKTGLTEVLRQQLSVAFRQVLRRRLLDPGCTAQDRR